MQIVKDDRSYINYKNEEQVDLLNVKYNNSNKKVGLYEPKCKEYQMRNYRLHLKKTSIWLIVILQIFFISIYFILKTDSTIKSEQHRKISFVRGRNTTQSNFIGTSRTSPHQINLQDFYTSHLYFDFNSSLCYKTGTDHKQMSGSSPNWKCKCLPGWHGNDCSQPEIIWRALLAYRKSILLKGPRKKQRHIIYLLRADEISLINTEIIVNELRLVVDLFVIYRFNAFLNQKLNDNVLYLKVPDFNDALKAVKYISNIQGDDLIISGGVNEIPNSLALNFFKLYDGWPQPVQFRYKWNMYGFFWMHPSKTIVKSNATTLAFVYEPNNSNKPFIIGDLNHFGGWYCQYCYESNNIIDLIIKYHTVMKLNNEKIDKSYIEDLIENGIALDGKTELIRARSYFDYYAPAYIVNNSWKYDWLYINLYSKMDYD